MLRISFLSIFILVLLMPVLVMGQKANAPKEACEVWRKTVTRTLYMSRDTTLHREPFSKMLFAAVQSGSIKAYSADVENFDSLLNKKQVNEITTIPPDTLFIDSPAIGRQYVRLVPHEFPYQMIEGYRLLENWEFDPSLDVTKITISKVAPVLVVYGDAGDYRGSKALFWLKWRDFSSVLISSEINPANALDELIWQDYFKDTVVLQEVKITPRLHDTMFATVRHNVVLTPDYTDDERPINLQEVAISQSLGERLFQPVLARKALAYRTAALNKQDTIPQLELQKIVAPRYDTVEVTDCWGEGPTRILVRDFPYHEIRKYSIKEEWTFDSPGIIHVKYTAVAPLQEKYTNEGNSLGAIPLFWCAYSSVKEILKNYREYHHENNIEWQLWNSRFSDPRRVRKWD